MESFKTEEKKKEVEKPKKKFVHLLDEEYVEVKRLEMEDVTECVNVMKKCAFEVTDKEVGNIVQYGNSFGATVNRMIVGVGLAWPAKLNLDTKKIVGGEPNALYMEDPAVLLAYEGKGVRRVLLKERESETKRLGLKYAIAYISEDIPKGDITDYLSEAGNALEKLYLSEDYEFFRTERGILAFKQVDKE